MSIYTKLDFIYWGSTLKCVDKNQKLFDYYGIQYNNNGKMYFQIDNDEIEEIEGSYAFISKPNFRIEYGAVDREKGRYHNFVTFNGDRIKDYKEHGLIDEDRPQLVCLMNANKFLENMHELHRELWKNSSSIAAINLLDKLLIMMQQEKNIANDRNYTYFHTLNNLFLEISNNPFANWDFEHEAKKMGVSLAHFRRLFTQQFSIAPHHFWLKMRLNIANKLLLETDMQIQEIADKCKFSDVFFFSRQFKNFNGISPLAFRKKNLVQK